VTLKKYIFTYSLLLFVIAGFTTASAQYKIPEKPSLNEQTSVYDYIDLLNQSQEILLRSKLIRYADSTSTQIVVVIISSTRGEDISFLGAKWGQKWGIGQADKDNGILITLAKDDRKIDINTGYGIETIVTDRMAERIINRIMVPQFKNGNYYEGLDQGADALFAALQGEYSEDREFNVKNDFPFILFIIFFLIIFILIKSKGGGKNGGRRGRSGSLLDVIILSNMGRTGGYSGSSGGGWSSGGGFSGGFGGGGFGGGGASGGW